MPHLLPKKICAKFKKAQHIVEIVLLAPFIIFFIGIIAEFAIIINTNYKFNSALYEAISVNALQNKIDTDKEDTISTIRETAKILLQQKFAPYRNTLQLKLIETGDIDFLIGTYKYTSTFTVLNPIEETYNFLAIIPVNSAILKQNSFNIDDSFFDTEFQKINLGSDTPEAVEELSHD